MADTATRIGGISFGVSMDTRKLRRNISSARRMMGSFVKGMTGAGALGLAGAATGAAFALRGLGKAHEDLNKSMNKSLAIMGDVSDMMRGEMRQAAIDVSATVNASASEVADGFFFLASAGLNAEQSLAALPKVAKFAQAGNFNLALATDLLTDAQSALGLSVDDTTENLGNLTQVSDVLVKANTLANATVQQFSESLTNKAGAGLRLVNKEIEEGVAVLSVYADQGIKGAEAGTALGIVLRDLQTKAIKFGGEFRKANVSVFDTTGNMRNMADIVGDLETALFGMSDQMKKSTLLNLGFSDKSVAFVQALLGTSDAIREYEKGLRSAGGITNQVANKNMTDLEKASNKLTSAWQGLSESMSPIVSKMAALTEDAAEFVRSLSGKRVKQDGIDTVDVRRRRSAFHGQQLKARGIDPASRGYFQSMVDFTNALPSDAELIRQQKEIEKIFGAIKMGIKVAGDPRKVVGKIATGVANARERISSRGQFGTDAVVGLFNSVGNGLKNAHSNAQAGFGKFLLEAIKLQGKARIFARNNNTPVQSTPYAQQEASLAKAGSAEAFRQRRQIELANKRPPKLDVQRNKILTKIEKKLEGPGEALAAANF